ncbi:uncharacterized protein MYU51_011377 [Penicillium brevicompactum]
MSVEKKRQRDRRSQQNLRDKKSKHTAHLEEQVAHCKQHHGDHAVQRLLEVITGLREENGSLRNRQNILKSLVTSWDLETDPVMPGRASLDKSSLHTDSNSREAPLSFHAAFHGPISSNGNSNNNRGSTCTPATGASAMETQSSSDASSTKSTPLWCQIPPHTDDFSGPPNLISCPWFCYPEKVTPCPDTPGSPLDILYGTKTNALADMIHTALQRRPIRDPERLAMGWLAYHLSRWFLNPTPATYERLPVFIRPVQGQIEAPHPLVLDFLPWPRLRVNVIRQWHLYCDNRDDLFGMFACCMKIRWPWGEDILERDDNNELQIKKKFYDTFTKPEGWGLTPEFTARYPNLVEGMDIREVLFELV